MTDEQKASYVMSQTICAMGELMGMQAENMQRQATGQKMAYYDEDFFKVPENYGIHHPAVIAFLAESG